MKDEFGVAALVQAYENGLYTSGELFAKILDLSDAHDLDGLTADLPKPLRSDFLRSARRLYDNDRPAEAFKNLHTAGHIPAGRLAKLRVWLSRQPKHSC